MSLLLMMGLHVEKVLKVLKSFKISFHQKDPTGLLACGGV
jgi:hypothetical protein